jgi:uncharacterized protein (TIGR00369 family)
MLQAKNENFKEKVLEKLKGQEFMKLMGFNLTEIIAGQTSGEMEIGKQIEQQDGFVHGGAVATIADIVAGFAAYTLVDVEERVVTAEIKVSYFRPAKGDRIYAIGKVIKPGSKFHFCEAEVWVQTGEKHSLVAKATTTMAVV